MHNKCLRVNSLNISGNFLLFVGRNQLGENYLTYSRIWGSQNTLSKITHYIFGTFRPLQTNHVCDNFRAHGICLLKIHFSAPWTVVGRLIVIFSEVQLSHDGTETLQSGKEKTHINVNKCAGLSRDWVISYGGKTHKQNPQKIPGRSRESLHDFLSVFFRGPPKVDCHGRGSVKIWPVFVPGVLFNPDKARLKPQKKPARKPVKTRKKTC